eukprot:474112-Rhodomonas_salina.1
MVEAEKGRDDACAALAKVPIPRWRGKGVRRSGGLPCGAAGVCVSVCVSGCVCVCVSTAVYGSSTAITGSSAAITGSSAAINGSSSATTGSSTAINGSSTAIKRSARLTRAVGEQSADPAEEELGR